MKIGMTRDRILWIRAWIGKPRGKHVIYRNNPSLNGFNYNTAGFSSSSLLLFQGFIQSSDERAQLASHIYFSFVFLFIFLNLILQIIFKIMRNNRSGLTTNIFFVHLVWSTQIYAKKNLRSYTKTLSSRPRWAHSCPDFELASE